ncbi:MAG TPA: lysylphosphatidylglycerol synthase transmembrane domain-containing protein [Gemmatimonadaceae bacterium]
MKTRVRNALGIALSVGFLVWTLWGVRISEVAAHLRHANLWYFAAATVAGTLIFPLRARRWRTILDPVAYHLPLGVLWRSTAIGMMVNNVVPARAGEFARAYALTRETSRVSFSAAFASLAVDRVFDAFVVLLLMLVAMFSPAFPNVPIGGHPVSSYVAVGAVVATGALGLLYLVAFFPGPVVVAYERLARRVAPRFEERGRQALLAFASGLGVLRHPGRFVAVLLWTIAHWLLNGLAFLLAFKAVGISAPFSAALLLQGLIAIGVAVPSAPGFFGIFEIIGQLGLGIYGVDRTLATSWAVGFHILTFIPITVIGIYYFGRLGLHFKELREAPEHVEEPAGAGAGAGAGSGSEAR